LVDRSFEEALMLGREADVPLELGPEPYRPQEGSGWIWKCADFEDIGRERLGVEWQRL